jgi:hypothetical protein
MTSALEVRRRFNVTEATRSRFNDWYSKRKPVVEHVMAHDAEVVHRLSPVEAERVFHQDSLGSALHATGERIVEIDDWRPEFAFTYTFHHAVEQLERLPRWPDFRRFCARDERAATMLWDPAIGKIEEVVRRGVDKDIARATMSLRVGRAYARWVREIYTVAYFRGQGMDVRVHPLADAVFRVDAWVGAIVLNLRGRHRSQDLLFQAMPPYFFEAVPMPEGLPTGRQLDLIMRKLGVEPEVG